MTESQRPRSRALVASLLALLSGLSSTASAQDLAAIGRELTSIEADAHNVVRDPLRRRALQSPTHVEERLTDGQLFYQLRDFIRASIIFTDIVDNYPQHRAFPDALYLLGDSLFRAGDNLGARTRFRQIISRADESAFRPYVQRALGRLIEIAIRTRNFDGVEEYFAQLSRLPPQEIEAATNYFRAKYLYSRAVPADEVMRGNGGGQVNATPGGQSGTPQAGGTQPAAGAQPAAPVLHVDEGALDQARQAFEQVGERSPYYPQSRYFIGVILTVRGQYPQAIEAFRRVLRSRATTPEQRQVAELTQLALGRLYYETDQLDQAVEAYQAVPRTSALFDIALYEIAWVYIRQGDSTRAERALEVLTIAAPESRYIPDAKILRGNLLLRNGRFDDANTVFRQVVRQFGPVRRELDDIVTAHADARGYFRDLVRQNMESFDANAFLPPLAIRWARIEGDMDRALSILSDLSQARQLTRETSELIERLSAALNSPNRVNIFADLRRHREQTISLRNRLARVRQQLIAGESRSGGGGEIAQVREQRRAIERFLGGMPTSDDDFVVRNERLLTRYRELERVLRDLEVELLGLDARIVATERYITDVTARNPEQTTGVEAARNELATHRAAVATYRELIQHLHMQIEAGRIQVGVGDSRYQRDDRLRAEYNRLVAREHELGGGGGEIGVLYRRADEIEATLEEHDRAIDQVVEERTTDMRRVLDEETHNVEGYRTRLGELETETVEVVGGVTFLNFNQVRARFYDLVLRADVGRIDVAWSQREEHRMRVEMLTRERSREIQALDDEFREIMDERPAGAPDEAPPEAPQTDTPRQPSEGASP